MADGRQFGTIVNERRLELGYSLGQFANRIGTTAAQVRAWERGDEIPDDTTVGRIAGELDLPGGTLRQSLKESRRTPTKPAPPEPTAVVAGAVVADKPSRGERPDGHGASDHSASSDTGKAVVDLPTEAVPMVPSAPPGRSVPEPRSRPVAAVPPSAPAAPASAPAGPPTGTGVATVNRPPAPRTVPDVVTDTPSTGMFAGWDRALRVVFDPNKRYLLWVRTGLTIVLMLVFLWVLAWAVPAFFDTLSDILDTIESSDTGLDRTGVPIVPEDIVDDISTSLPTG